MGRNRIAQILLGIFLIPFAYFAVRNWKTLAPGDFFQYRLAGQAISTMKVANIYSLEDTNKIQMEFSGRLHNSPGHAREAYCLDCWGKLMLNQTPFLYAFIHLFSSPDFSRDYRWFRAISAIFFILSIAGLGLLLNFSPLWVIGLIAFFRTWYYPLSQDIYFANTNQIQVGVLGLFMGILSRRESFLRNVLAGFVLGILIAIKPNTLMIPAFLFTYWAIAGRFKTCREQFIGILIAAIISVILPMVLFGQSCDWRSWIQGVKSVGFSNLYTPSPLYHDIIRRYPKFLSLAYFLVPAAELWFFRPNFKKITPDHAERNTEYLLTGLGITAYLLSSPHIHEHYFLLLVPLIIMLLRPLPDFSWHKKESRIWRLTFLGIVAFAVVLLALHPLQKACYFYGTLILYFSALWDLHTTITRRGQGA